MTFCRGWFLAGAIGITFGITEARADQPRAPIAFDAREIQARLDAHRTSLAEIRDQLQRACLDAKLSARDRLRAVTLLSRFDDAGTIRFLVTHQSLVLELGSEIQSALVFPCRRQLENAYVGNLTAAKHLLLAIDLVEDESGYHMFATTLRKMIGDNLAVVFVENELSLRPKHDRRRRLELLLSVLQK